MNKKYIALLLTIFLLVSCGGKGKTQKKEIINEAPRQESPAETEEVIIEEEEEDGAIDEANLLDPEVEAARIEAELKKQEEAVESEPVPTELVDEPEVIDEGEDVQPDEPVVEEEKEAEPVAQEKQPESKVIDLTQTYVAPPGNETIQISIDILGDTIQSVSITPVEVEHEVSQGYISRFASGVNGAVVGKTLEEAENIGIVSGSSLTTGAFKQALKDL